MVNKPLVIAAIGAATIGAAITVNEFLWQDEVVETAAIQPAAEKAVSGGPAKGPEGGPAGTQGPSFDVIRVEPGGDAVMAGRAKPGSTVVIMADGKPIGEVTADGRGEWVFVPTAPLKPGSRELSLEMRLPGGKPVASEDVVVLVVPEPEKALSGSASIPWTTTTRGGFPSADAPPPGPGSTCIWITGSSAAPKPTPTANGGFPLMS